MGLDMYLYKSTYIWRYEHIREQHSLPPLTLDYPGIQADRVRHIDEIVGEWRKANAIHHWFVETVQRGVDECQRSHVSIDHIKELLAAVEQVEADHGLASELLPTQSGFFFGSLEYDTEYFDDLAYTAQVCRGALTEASMIADPLLAPDYYYESSW
jgi:hypothetical protein